MPFDNTNSGALFKNADREKDAHPNYKGSLNVDGTDYWISAWLKKDKNGNPYMSLAVKPKDEAAPKAKPKSRDDADDDIPF